VSGKGDGAVAAGRKAREQRTAGSGRESVYVSFIRSPVTLSKAGEFVVIFVYLVALVSFLAIDAVVLRAFMLPLFSRHIGDMFREETLIFVAFGFYAFFVAGLLYLAVIPALADQNVWRAVKNGAVIGFISYGTYEATNMATLRGWAWPMVVADVSWGTILSATVAAIAYGVGKAVA
jgi:uncharacterized membrane protein